MKIMFLKLSVTLAALLLVSPARAVSTLPFYEPFTNATLAYAESEQLGLALSSGVIWDFGNSVSSSCGRIRSVAGLSYPGLTTTLDSRGLVGGPTAGTSAKSRGATFTPQTNVTLYASFLLNLQALPASVRPIAAISADTTGTSVGNVGPAVFVDPSGRLLVSKNSTAAPTSSPTYTLVTNTTYLVVFRYKYNTGSSSDDEVALWLNPTTLGNNASVPPATVSTTNGSDRAELRSFGHLGPLPIFAFWQDEIRVSTNWADVTPTNCSAGITYNVTGGGVVCAGAGFPVGVSGSEVGVDYLLHTNGVVSAMGSGTGAALSFGTQSENAVYTVLASNTTSTCVSWVNGSAVVALLAAPSIGTQPAAVTVATGGAATLSVAAAGDGLTYQWRRNGINLANAGHFSGVTTPNLTIYPADAGDVATALNGYDVVVSGTCSPPATSTRVALTSKSVSDLIWSGDGSANLWDVATTANWNANAAQFFFGDRVTFDDTSANTTVVLANNFLSPASITVNGSQNYAFAPGGKILGPATTLLMNGFGILVVTNANTFGGGTTISNGAVSINNNASLGGGPITLAGGTLDLLNAQVTLTNSILVKADSTITIRNTSTSALQLDGDLSGTGGTLTLNNATAAGPTIRLMPNNLTFNRPLVLSIGTGNRLLLAPYNTNGNQTFNGVISGGGSIERRTTAVTDGAGNTILNGDNTYSGGTLLRDGGLGLGISSTSTTPPTVDSGPLGTGPLTIDTNAAAGMKLFALGGARFVGNPIVYLGADVGPALIISGANDLTLSGTIDLGTATRTYQVDNTGKTVFAGDISNGGLTKTGAGDLYLNGNNFYADPTLVSGGTLGGTGTLSGPVTVASGATLAPGSSVGTLTINSDLTINGNLAIEVNKSLSPANDLVVVSGLLTNGGTGTVKVTNLGAALGVNDSFTLFSQPLLSGNVLTVSGGGAVWTNRLALDGSIAVLSLAVTAPTNISFSVGGNSLTISWPASHLGWSLQAQTNSLNVGLSSNWTTVPGSEATTSMNFNIAPGNPAVFYRLFRSGP